jgi:hypothetical protein
VVGAVGTSVRPRQGENHGRQEFECPLESSVVEWLQEIIEGSCVESPQRVFVISRDKYDRGRHIAAAEMIHDLCL